jgi:hypothetical protein
MTFDLHDRWHGQSWRGRQNLIFGAKRKPQVPSTIVYVAMAIFGFFFKKPVNKILRGVSLTYLTMLYWILDKESRPQPESKAHFGALQKSIEIEIPHATNFLWEGGASPINWKPRVSNFRGSDPCSEMRCGLRSARATDRSQKAFSRDKRTWKK